MSMTSAETPEEMRMTDPIEAAARAMCFAPGYTLPDGELIKECDCASADECFEINGPLKAEMIGKAQAVIDAHHEASGTVAVSQETVAALKKARDEMPPLYNDHPVEYMRLLHAVGAMIAAAEKEDA